VNEVEGESAPLGLVVGGLGAVAGTLLFYKLRTGWTTIRAFPTPLVR